MSGSQLRASINDVPPEIILERLLPVLGIRDLLSLSATNKTFNSICNDESHWLHRTRLTFSYNPHSLAPASPGSGWSKRLYIGLSHPEPFVWGSADNDRLGLPEVRGAQGRVVRYNRKVTRPESLAGQFRGEEEGGARRWVERLGADLRRERERKTGGEIGGEGRGSGEGDGGVGIVEMHAGGWSFAARDMAGKVWVWGQLDGDLPAFRSVSWANKHERVPEPTPIPLPCRAEAISVGRRHMLILDEDNLIWEMRDWGRAYHHTSPSLTSPANPGSTRRPHHIVQLSTGWSHSACLTSSGKIFVWFPFTPAYEASLTPEEDMNGPLGVRGDGDESRAVRWGTVGKDVVTELEGIPERPKWESQGEEGEEEMEVKEAEWAAWEGGRSEKEREKGERVVKIASGQGFIVALRGNGEVWFRLVEDGRSSDWEYLPFFSSPQITHITAQFTSLTSYSTSSPSRVYHARLPPNTSRGFGALFHPDSLPGLQGKGVIQVALGDYHFAALTSRGEMWTWGQGSAGQLGLGDVGTRGETVDEPRKVEFASIPSEGSEAGKGKAKEGEEEPFIFAITAAGWHTGALVMGSNRRSDHIAPREKASISIGEASTGRPQSEEGINMPGAFPTTGPQSLGSTSTPSSSTNVIRPGNPLPAFGMPQFRIGLAGGLGRGIAVGLEPQYGGEGGDGEQQIPMLDHVPGSGGPVERNWVRTSRRGLGGSVGPPSRKGDEM